MALLVTAATDFEMRAFVDAGGNQEHTLQLITGIGPVETALSMSSMLHKHCLDIDAVINFGIAGAYFSSDDGQQVEMLDICLAKQEVFGDLGIYLEDRVERFAAELAVRDRFVMNTPLLSAAGSALEKSGFVYKQGIFVTVSCASGTQKRGRMLRRQYQGLCENMEGAAVARVCEEFSKPCLEVRCISNMVEDRNRMNWKLRQACEQAGRATTIVINYLNNLNC